MNNPAFDGNLEAAAEHGPDEGIDTGQAMSKSRKENEAEKQELRSPLLEREDVPVEDGPSPTLAPPVPDMRVHSENSIAEISRMLAEEERRQHDMNGLRSGFFSDNVDAGTHRRLDERDYEGHRSEEFPHVHQPLGSMHPVHRKRSRKASGSSATPSLPDVSDAPGSESDSPARFVPSLPCISSAPDLESVAAHESSDMSPKSLTPHTSPLTKGEYTVLPAITKPAEPADSHKSDQVGFFIGDETPALSDPHGAESTSPRLAISTDLGQAYETEKGKQPVRFQIGSDASLDTNNINQDEMKINITEEDVIKSKHNKREYGSGRRKHHKHHHHRHDPDRRRHKGSDLQYQLHRIPTETDEALLLADSDLAQMSDRRFGDPRGIRRHIISPSAMVTVGKMKESEGEITPKFILPRKLFDHEPHDMFVELDELLLTDKQEYEWQEKARWIKFEEDVEENLGRWGKPHVASLSFHSLLELRHCIEHGVILLDLEDEDLPSIVTRLVDQLVTDDLLPAEQKGLIIRALLLKHRHVNEGGFAARRRGSAFPLSHERRSSLMGNLFRSNSTVDRKSPYVLRKSDLLGSNGSNMNVLPDNRSHVSLPTIIVDNDTPLSEKEGKKSNGTSPSNTHHVSFSTVQEVGNGKSEKTPLEDNTVIKNLHTIHTVAPQQLGSHTSSQASISDSYQEGHSNILRRIPKGAEATTVMVGNMEPLSRPIMAFLRLSEGRFLNNVTEVNIPVRFIFFLLGPSTANLDYHEIGRSIATLMANTLFHEVAYRAEDRRDLLDAINEFLDDSIVLPPGEWDRKTLLPIMDMAKKKQALQQEDKRLKSKQERDEPPKRDPLQRTGRPFGGVIEDIKQRYPFWLSDIKDGLNMQCLATFFFIYFACLSPAITFGGLIGDKTKKWMGVSEMIVGVGLFGCVFALFSGQPASIAGATGPLLIFEEGLYKFSQSIGLEYMPWRFWTMMWMGIITLVVALLEGGVLVKFITRFTEEIFALLIALIFIFETFSKVYKVFQRNPLLEYYPPPWCDAMDEFLYTNTTHNDSMRYNSTTAEPFTTPALLPDNVTMANDTTLETPLKGGPHPNTALLSFVLTFSTFLLATYLKQFRNSKFLGRSARRALGDFGVPIAIFVMVLIDYLIQETFTEKLDVPDGLQPTSSHLRGWFINPMGIEKTLPAWAIFAAIIPGMLVFILVYMETQISSMIVNKKDRKLKKGSGYHLDLLLLGCYAFIAGIIGLPVLCVATVRSVSHVSALTVYSRTHAPGDKPKLEMVHEQRLTGLAVHIMICVSLLLGPVLRQIPLAVLFGVFLYMGVSSTAGLQLLDRICFILMPRKYHYDVRYVRRVNTYKMHLFTAIQLVCLGVLWAVKSTQASLAFPFVLIVTVPLRYFVLKFIFTEKELAELDNAGGEVDEDEDEPDFYQQAHNLQGTENDNNK